MAFVVATRGGRFEVRESHSTPDGPRSKTLASFTELSDDVIEKAQARAAKPLDPAQLREAAVRVGAAVAGPPVDDSARDTLRRVASGEQLDPILRRLLLDALSRGANRDLAGERPGGVSDTARAVTHWMGTSLAQRGEALRDLLELADALPLRIPSADIGFPRLKST